ncbi:MAG TPA: metallophosphoesterase [Candidatus Paceibacterota bacterium]|nr:metallophosphoesterase [Candidatus Paceibacterota bacterium]
MNQQIISFCGQKGILLDKQILDLFVNISEDLGDINIIKNVIEHIELKYKQRVITKSFFLNNPNKLKEILLNYNENTQNILLNYFKLIGIEIKLKTSKFEKPQISVVNSDSLVNFLKIYQTVPKKIEVDDFVKNLRNRFIVLKNILQQRVELDNLTSINKINESKNYSIIGLVYNKKVTKNDNILLEVEDLTGKITVLINKNREDVFEKSKEILLDEVIGLKCSGSKEILFVNDIIFPESRLTEKKKSNFDESIAFISDIHVGSKKFLEKNFLKFINWINGNIGSDKQRQEALKVNFLFITGDTIDGVGVYPGQERELDIEDVNEQYKKLTELLLKIRPNIKIIMCAGQHDAVRVAEPQPIIGEWYGNSLYMIPNLNLVTNPSLIEVGSDVKFKVLMYHGASMHGIIDSIDKLRLNRGQDHPTEVVKFMLKKRHLAPSHSLTTYTPSDKEDPLLILDLPDIVSTGDLHRPEVSDYNGILLVSSSCWQSKTAFEEKVGNDPDPCKVPIFNLKTREVKILDFSENCDNNDYNSEKNCEENIDESKQKENKLIIGE